MTDRQYAKLKEQARSRYDSAIEAAERALRDELRSIEVVYRMSHGAPITADSEPDSAFIGPRPIHVEKPKSSRATDLSEYVLKVLQFMPPHFTPNDVLEKLEQEAPELNGALKRKSVFNALQNLVGSKLAVLEQGRGRRPTVYQRAKT